uniref:COPI coat complex subunit epsilon n=1 Tax=Macaca fascicularis TaxID=9541 RepID=I7GKC8_MACFA|nr:unnamed protein product [Macaca fascicularis]
MPPSPSSPPPGSAWPRAVRSCRMPTTSSRRWLVLQYAPSA